VVHFQELTAAEAASELSADLKALCPGPDLAASRAERRTHR